MSDDATRNIERLLSRRRLLQMATGVAASALLAACGDNTATPATQTTAAAKTTAATNAAPVTINHWYWADDPNNPTYKNLVTEFMNTHPNIKVNSQLIGMNDLRSKLLTGLTAGELPDVCRFKEWWMADFTKGGYLEPLDSYISGWKSNEIISNLWNLQKVKASDPVYMLPWQALYLYMYYRTDWFKEKSLKPPDTLDDFLAAAKALSDGTRYGYGMRGGAGGQDPWAMLTWPNGMRFIDDTGKILIDSDDSIKATQWYIDLFRTQKVVPPTAPADSFAEIIGAFEAGKTAMLIHHVGSSQRLVKSVGEDKFAAWLPPAGPKGRMSIVAIDYNVIFKSSKNKEAAWTFASWLSEKQQNDTWASGTGVLPVVSSLSDKYAAKDKFYKTSIDCAQYAGIYPLLPTLGKWTSTIFTPAMQQALNGQIDAKTLSKTLADGLRA